MSAAPNSVADDQVRSAFERWKNLEEEKSRIADDLKELFGEQKALGHDTKAMRAAFRLKVKMDEASPEDAEHEALVDTYLAALQAPRASRAYARENIEKFDAATGEILDRAERRRQRMSESMDDHKALVDEMADAGLISEEARIENKALADAVATKFGNGPAIEMDRATEGSFETGSEAAENARKAIPAGPEDGSVGHAGAGESPATEITIPSDDSETTGNCAGETSVDANTGGSHVTGSSISAWSTAEGHASAPSAKRSALRPHCLNPGEACGGWGSNHCHTCKLAMRERELA